MKRTVLFSTALWIIIFQGQAQINTQSVDSIVQQAVIKELFEGTVLVADKGNIVYQKSYGFKDDEKVDPIQNSTSYSVASITKMFTAIMIMQLIDEDKVKLTDNLSVLLPEYMISKAADITVHHLLLHISGLPNENDALYRDGKKEPRDFVNETLLNDSNGYGEFNYANIDYVLLGLIIEKIDKQTFEQSLHQRILDKTGMTQTGLLEKGKLPEDFAYTFSYDEAGNRQADPSLFIENYYAAGAMYSTSEDLLKLDQTMYGNELISDESKELMYTSYPEYNYSGYSVWTYNYPFANSQPKVMERRGGILGANSVLIRLLDMNKTIIILSNNNKFNPDSFGNTEGLKEALIIEVDKTDD